MSTGYALTETDRRLANVVTIGTISAVDVANGLAKVDLDGPESGWIPWSVPRAGGDRSWWAPEVGEQVVVAAPSGDLGNAVVLGCLYQDSHPEPADSADVHRTVYSDGTVVEYDRAAHQMLVDLGNNHIQINRTSISLKVGSVELNISSSGVTVTGNMAVNGVSLTHNGKSVGSNHAHTGVVAGGSNTGPPA